MLHEAGALEGFSVGTTMGGGQELTEEDRVYLRRFLRVLEHFLQVQPTMPLHLVTAYLRVALEEGKSVTEYANDSGVAKSLMSRHLRNIGNEGQRREPGLGLVRHQVSDHSLRAGSISLTQRGRTLAKTISTIMAKGAGKLRELGR